jgi:hypothetical protein
VADQTKGRGGARAGAGRKAKPKIELSATKGIASSVLRTLPEVEIWRFLAHADAFEDLVPGSKLSAKQIDECKTKRAELTRSDRYQIESVMDRLTNRRDGKPAQGIFTGDTRETAPALTRGNLPTHFDAATRNAAGSHKPN